MATINYIRVSSITQNTARQLVGVDCDKEFIDTCSGKDLDRPAFQEMVGYVREGDVISVHELSRLARNTQDLLAIVKSMNDKGVTIKFIKEGLIFSGERDPFQDLMLTMLAAISTFERDLILERQREGIAIAKQEGRYKGRPSSFSEEEVACIRSEFIQATNKAELARKYGISRSYLYKLVSPS
jgi:DNA invertase Pin-like site-specific DNA recombinase